MVYSYTQWKRDNQLKSTYATTFWMMSMCARVYSTHTQTTQLTKYQLNTSQKKDLELRFFVTIRMFATEIFLFRPLLAQSQWL